VGEFKAVHPLADEPSIFERTELSKPAVQQLIKRARQTQNTPQYHIQINKTYSFQQHIKWA
jgi:hypothetical protein